MQFTNIYLIMTYCLTNTLVSYTEYYPRLAFTDQSDTKNKVAKDQNYNDAKNKNPDYPNFQIVFTIIDLVVCSLLNIAVHKVKRLPDLTCFRWSASDCQSL